MTSERDLATFNRLLAFLSGSACGLDALIRRVEERALVDDPLDHVRVAAAMAEELSQASDNLLGCFVDRARHAGRSWTEIGHALGVTKQAAHERFVGPDLSRFTNRARAAVVLASDEASHLGYRWVGPEHILIGLLREGGGIAGRALLSLGVSLDAVRALVVESVPGSATARTGEMTPPLTPQAMRLLGETSPAAAVALGHNYVGTEHLLLALSSQADSSVGKMLAALGVGDSTTRTKVLELLAEYGQPDAPAKSP